MSVSTSPPAPPPTKKRGLGCLGCGCLLLALLVVLFFALVGGIIYASYTAVMAVTTEAPPAIPSSSGTDDQFQATRQKLADFDHDVKDHQAATIQLSADEINNLLAHNPDIIRERIHAFVSFNDASGRLQMSLPTETVSRGALKGRYLGIDVSFTVHFDPATRSVILAFQNLSLGSTVLIDQNAASDSSAANTSFSEGFVRGFSGSFVPAFNQSFNEGIRKNPDGAAMLDEAKSIEITGGQLVLETR